MGVHFYENILSEINLPLLTTSPVSAADFFRILSALLSIQPKITEQTKDMIQVDPEIIKVHPKAV